MTTQLRPFGKTWLERTLSIVTDVRPGEGALATLMLLNIFLLMLCYSIIKTVREPLILLGGGAALRSYSAAGQALALIGFVPLYSWIASRVDRVKLLVGVSLFFLVNIELFAAAVAARVPYVGVAFFIWVGIFNMSQVAQFWAYANDIYTKQAGDRLFPMIVIGQTAGAPLGAFAAGQLFALQLKSQAILQISAVLLAAVTVLYLVINTRATPRVREQSEAQPLGGPSGFSLVFRSQYLLPIAILLVLLNGVNTTGEYFIAQLNTDYAAVQTAANPAFNSEAYFGAFAGSYQFWVNVLALVLQAFVTSRLVKHQGLRGVLLALPLIALGGYAVIAAGVSFAVVRWIKTAENATDYSIMNTARQLLWLPTSRDEKYKAKQAIDSFFVRIGDLLSAAIVFVGVGLMHLTIGKLALVNIVLILAWLAVALVVLRHHRALVERRAEAA